VVTALLEDLVERGVRPNRRRLFVIDGAKALRKAIDQVFGRKNEVQRYRNHKRRNVLSHLAKEQHTLARSVLAAAWKLAPKEGKKKIEQHASWLQAEWPSATDSLRETPVLERTCDHLSLK
jgi:putative transposase